MPPKQRNIIITADDYGCCDFIDRGIIKGISKGVITCVSAFVNFQPRKKNQKGGAYKGSVEAIKKLLQLYPNFPIGLHLTINAGSSVLPPTEIINLIQSKKKDGKYHFKSFKKFDPKLYFKKSVIKEIKAEVQAQIKLFKSEFPTTPINHLSCHYGILFHFEKILKEILTIPEFQSVALRNPSLVFQTPISKHEAYAKEFKEMQQFFRSKSKMRIEGLGTIIKWSSSLEQFFRIVGQGGNIKKRLTMLQNNNSRFPHFTLDYLYRRQSDFTTMGIPIAQLVNEIPEHYSNPGSGAPIYEFIVHVGSGALPKAGPIGVSKNYFKSRILELKRLIDSKAILQTNSIKLVDYRSTF